MSLQTPLLIGLVGGVVGLFVWALERDEKGTRRMGICPEQWKAGEARVKARMSNPWKRAERRLFGLKRLGDIKGAKQ